MVGDHSMKFIAELGRLGFKDHQVKVIYKYALEHNLLRGSSRAQWMIAVRWYREKQSGGSM